MSRSGYSEDYDLDNWNLIRWRGQVASAIRGKRGQAFLRELIEALDAMPEKRLIAHELRQDGEVCALGSVGVKRGVELEKLDPVDYDTIAGVFGIAHQLVQEIEWINDEGRYYKTPEERWQYMRAWAAENLKAPA
jgi:hypothetical protein